MLEIQAPDIKPTTGGLLGTLQAVPATAQATLRGVTYTGALCGHSRRVPAPGTDKLFDQLPTVESVKFSVYRGVEDSLFQDARVAASAREAYDRGKGWAVERAVQELLLNGQTLVDSEVIETVDLTPTPGTPVTNKKLVLGLLQQYAADQYSGLPMLHSNRLGTELLDVELEGGRLTTKQGVPLVNGGGYGPVGPNGLVAPPGAAWAYVSGEITLHEQEVKAYEPARALRENRVFALVEGTWLATVDCFVAAILVGT